MADFAKQLRASIEFGMDIDEMETISREEIIRAMQEKEIERKFQKLLNEAIWR